VAIKKATLDTNPNPLYSPPSVTTNTKKLLRQLVIGGVLTVLVFVGYQRGLLDGLEFKSLDLRFQIRGAVPVHLPMVIVSIDQDSFDELDLQWPWPRALHAELIRKLAKAGAKVIAFDVLFTEPHADARQDRALADAIRETGNVVLGAEHTEVPGDLGTRTRLSLPIPLIRQYAKGYGPANLINDRDGIVRSGRFALPFQERKFPGFAYRIYEAATGKEKSNGDELSTAPYFINFRGPGRNYPIVPYYRVLRDEFDPAFFRGKVVLVGAYSPSLHDFFSTPFSASQPMAGVEIQANFVDTVAAGDPIVPIPGWLLAALFFVLSALAVGASIHLRPLRATATVLGLIALYGFAALYLFSYHQLWIAVVPVALAGTLSYGGIVLDQYIREQKERLRMRGMLNKYLSPDVVEEMLKLPEGLKLEGKRTHITVLFSDVRGFTAMSEQISPEQVVALLSDYLGRAAQIVVNNKGVIDKFIGDAVFAFFGWPHTYGDDAYRAVKTGIEMIELVESLGPKWTEIIGRPLKVGVGINTGEAVVGNIGSESKSDLTAIGDTVNLGARLEALTKELGVPMLISEFTAAELKNGIPLRALRQVKVQGREAPILVYCPESLVHGDSEIAADVTTPYVQQHK
jgi:adenylate cyclase